MIWFGALEWPRAQMPQTMSPSPSSSSAAALEALLGLPGFRASSKKTSSSSSRDPNLTFFGGRPRFFFGVNILFGVEALVVLKSLLAPADFVAETGVLPEADKSSPESTSPTAAALLRGEPLFGVGVPFVGVPCTLPAPAGLRLGVVFLGLGDFGPVPSSHLVPLSAASLIAGLYLAGDGDVAASGGMVFGRCGEAAGLKVCVAVWKPF